MKNLLLYFCLFTLTMHSMQQPLSAPEKPKDPFFKEFRMQMQENPGIVRTCGTILFVSGLMQPYVALISAAVGGLTIFITYCQDREHDIQERKSAKDKIAHLAFSNCCQASIKKICQSDEYQQTDKVSLRHQNTAYLIYLLEKLSTTTYPTLRVNYENSLAILVGTHADLCHARHYFQNRPNNTLALKWLNSAQA